MISTLGSLSYVGISSSPTASTLNSSFSPLPNWLINALAPSIVCGLIPIVNEPSALAVVPEIVAVPVFALVYGYFDNLVQNKLLDKKLPSDKESYDDLERINSESKRLVKKTLK